MRPRFVVRRYVIMLGIMTSIPNLYDLALPDLEMLLHSWGQPAYRARQIYRQLYHQLATDPFAMTDLPLALRERLAAETRIGALELARLQTADAGLTRKASDGSVPVRQVRLPERPQARVTDCR